MQESNNQKFNHLKIHTQYSICEGAIKIEDLAEYCKDNKVKAIGISDSYNLCGALEFSEAISKVINNYFSFLFIAAKKPLIKLVSISSG